MQHTFRPEWAVFPLFKIEGKACGCSAGDKCDRIGKHPAAKRKDLAPGQKKYVPPECGYGIATGTRSGFFVLDIDVKPGKNGLEGLKKLGFEVPETFTVRTGTGGYHFYFQLPDDFLVKDSAGEIAPGVDVRGETGMVVGPGSPHANGKLYEIQKDVAIAKAPEWLLGHKALRQTLTSRDAANNAPKAIDEKHPDWEKRKGMGLTACLTMPPSIEGENGSLAAWNLAQYLVRELQLPLDVCRDLWVENFNDRCVPPWSEKDIRHKLEDARDKGHWETWDEREGKRGTKEEILWPGKPLKYAQVKRVLENHEVWEGVFRFDVLSRKHVAIDPPFNMSMQVGNYSDGDDGKIKDWFARFEHPASKPGDKHGCEVSSEDVKKAVFAICESSDRKYSPVLEYWASLPKAMSTPTLDRFHELLDSADGKIVSAVFKRHLVAAVRRQKHMPGVGERGRHVEHHIAILLHGREGVGKTQLCKALGGEFHHSLKGDLKDGDTITAAYGKLIVEIEEMRALRVSDKDAYKAFITAASDEIRMKYARAAVEVNRSWVPIITANDTALDDDDNRRFACFKVGAMKWKEIRDLAPTIWAEAIWLESTGESNFLDDAEKAEVKDLTARFEIPDPIEEALLDYLPGKAEVTTTDIYWEAIKCLPSASPRNPLDIKKGDLNRIGKILRDRLGYTQVRRRDGDKVLRVWIAPEHMARRAKLAVVK